MPVCQLSFQRDYTGARWLSYFVVLFTVLPFFWTMLLRWGCRSPWGHPTDAVDRNPLGGAPRDIDFFVSDEKVKVLRDRFKMTTYYDWLQNHPASFSGKKGAQQTTGTLRSFCPATVAR